MGRPDTPELYRSWRTLADEHEALLLGEVYLSSPEAVATYLEPGLLHRAFFLPLQHTDWDRDQVEAMIAPGVAVGHGQFAWPQSSHDDPRAGSRFGGGALGAHRALAFFHLIACLPGTPVMLAGDELGLDDGVVVRAEAEDPVTVRNEDRDDGRDGSRTPMPWSDGPNLGFTTATPWLPLGTNRGPDDTVAAQEEDPSAPLHRMRRFLDIRAGLEGMLVTDEITWLAFDEDVDDQLLGFRRGDVVAVCNFGLAITVDLPGADRLLVASSDDAAVADARVDVGTDTTVLVRMDD